MTKSRSCPLHLLPLSRLGPLIALLLLSSGSSVLAQMETVDAEVVSVNPAAGSMELTYKAPLGKTQTSLDISRKATITINGAPGTLEELKKGQKATVIVNTDLAVITSIEATGDAASAELIPLMELDGSFPTLTQDGLMICYEAKGEDEPMIYSAHRENPESPFTAPRPLLPGRHPALSGDGLELMFLQLPPGKKTRTLHVATRKSVTASFGKPVQIRELSQFEYPRGPFLSADGLTLCFRTANDSSELVCSRRRTRGTPWLVPEPLLAPGAEKKLGGQLTWPWLAEDGLKLLATLETGGNSAGKPNLYLLKRSSPERPFSQPVLIEHGAIPMSVRSPRYLPQTGELFLSGVPKTEHFFGIGVVQGFSIPE